MVTDLTGCFTPSKSTGPDAMEVERKVGGARNGPRWSQKGCGTLRFRPNLDSQRRAASRLLTRTLQSIHIQIVRPLPPSPYTSLDDFKHGSEKVLSCPMERQCIDIETWQNHGGRGWWCDLVGLPLDRIMIILRASRA